MPFPTPTRRPPSIRLRSRFPTLPPRALAPPLAPGRSMSMPRSFGTAAGATATRGIDGVAGREEILKKIRDSAEFDVLVIGGGATGAGVALDAATRGLKVVMVEKEDYGSGTSSRSTKLLWAGVRYLAGGFATLFQRDMLMNPRETLSRFYDTFKMVMGCQRERNHLLKSAPHLTNWIPLIVPIDKWFIWPPPMKCPPAAFGPMGVYYLFFKFYDMLAKFSCPSSHIITKSSLLQKFPQLHERIKYACVFFEGQHDDSRTNIAIALTAAENGACVVNHTEVVKLLDQGADGTIDGAVLRDRINGEEITIRTQSVVMCGGPFTDSMRDMETDEKLSPIVNGVAGTHIVLPGYLCPRDTGMVNMATSDGRILFYLPWEGHTLIGTTDVKCKISDRPAPTEEEINWIIDEANFYLTEECKISRKDVLSAWSGIRPLAVDPHGDRGGPASRDHIVSVNPTTKTVFVAGGKWTTYREMAEDAVNKLVEVQPKLKLKSTDCRTLDVPLLGAKGFSRTLALQLAKEYSLNQEVSERLVRCYGGRAQDVCKLIQNGIPELLVEGFPYLAAEVVYACREHARTVEDVISRRTRLSYLNLRAAKQAVPKVAAIMSAELGWNEDEKMDQMLAATEFLRSFAGAEEAETLNN